MITVTIDAADIGLAKNNVAVTMSSDKELASAGSVAEVQLKFNGGTPSVNQTIILAWGTHSVTLTCKASPDDSGLQFADNAGALSLTNWVTTLFAQALINNPLLFADYDITVNSSDPSNVYAILTAKLNGTAYTLTVTNGLTHCTVTTNTAGVDDTYQSNFRYLVDTYIEADDSPGEFEYAGQLDAIAHTDSLGNRRGIVRLEKLLRKHLSPARPGWNETLIARAGNTLKQYYYRAAEQYGEPAVTKILTNPSLNTKKVLLGGVAFNKFTGSIYQSSYFGNANGRKFLTNQPRTKKVSPAQKEWLYWYITASEETVHLYANLYFTDNTSSLAHNVLSLSSLISDIYMFPTGYYQLNLDSIAGGKTISKYEIYVTQAGTAKTSETFTYILDRRTYYNCRYFLFFNSLGGFDTLRCTGSSDKGLVPEFLTAERIIPPTYEETDQETFDDHLNYTETSVVNSGYFSKAYMDHLQDLLISSRVYEYGDSDLVPVRLDHQETTLYALDQNTISLNFKVYRAFKNSGL